jgi:integrase
MATKTKRAAHYGSGGIRYDEARQLWIGTVELPPHPDGRRNRKRVTHRDKQTMLDKRDALREQVRRGDAMPTKGWTVRSWGDHYLAHLAPVKSRQTYSKVLRCWVYPHIGTRPIANLQPEHVDRMLAALETRGLADGTRAVARRVLACVLTEAMRRPALGVRYNVAKLTKAPPSSKLHDPLTVEEVQAVFDASEGDRLHALTVLALTTGLRKGECLALRWEHVDLKRATLTVVEGKTIASLRTIPLPAQLVDALRAHQAAQRAERIAAPYWHDAGLVFPDIAGGQISCQNCTRWWHGITEAAGLGKRRFHATRHTCGQVMLNNGADLDVVSAILGHSTVAITAAWYAKPDANKLRSGPAAITAAYAAPA